MMVWSKKKQICLIFVIVLICVFIFPRFSEPAAEPEEILEKIKEKEKGEKESTFHIQNMEIQTLLKALAMKNQVNIVSTPEVKGRITLNLSNATVEETLTAITKSMGLRWAKEGSVYVVSAGTAKGEQDFKTVKSFQINYADLEELSKVIQWSFAKSRIMSYENEQILLIEDKPQEFPNIQNLISSLDIPPKQALIEAQILEINLSDDTSYGLDWGDTFANGLNTSGQINTPGPQFPENVAGTDPSKFYFGLIKPTFYVKLSALQKKGDVKTLATPRLMVLNGKSAQILIGGRIGYYLTTTTETSTLQSVEFLDIGTQLQLTPQITDDGTILMTIHPEVSDGSLSGGLPQKTTTSVSTSIMVKTGETIFIGGLIRNSEIKSLDRLPLLGRIPIFGKLFFSKSSTQVQRKELIILLTPRLVASDQKIVQGVENERKDTLKKEIHEWREKITTMEESKPDK
ncbi:MAG: hypothetical protein JXA79_10905 [Deltaproteobacteria bacterium]|nr:hypothetical protein [Deltaproteobacteria bacterium]